MMKLFYVRCDNFDGENNLDLFVEAETPERAKELWQDHYSLDDDDEIQIIIYEPRPVGREHALPWGTEAVREHRP